MLRNLSTLILYRKRGYSIPESLISLSRTSQHSQKNHLHGLRSQASGGSLGKKDVSFSVIQIPRIALYKAAGHPVEMDVSLRPNFYQDGVDSIEVDALEKVVNKDRYCFSLCDGLNQQAFLKRCHSLKTLEINIDHPKFFSWAVERNLSAMGTLDLQKSFSRNCGS